MNVCVVLETEQKRLFGWQILKLENPGTTYGALLLLSSSCGNFTFTALNRSQNRIQHQMTPQHTLNVQVVKTYLEYKNMKNDY